LNDDYQSCLKYNTLKPPVARVIPTQEFYSFMEEKGKFGSQQKFPRVMNKHQLESWKRFIGD
jgi:hypothetical protein